MGPAGRESVCLQERWKSRSRLRGWLRWEGVVEDRRLCRRLVNLGCKTSSGVLVD